MLVMLVVDLLEGKIHILKHVSVLLTWNLWKSSMLELQPSQKKAKKIQSKQEFPHLGSRDIPPQIPVD